MERPRPPIAYTTLDWTEDQHTAFNNMVEKRPDLAKIVFEARTTFLSAGKKPPQEVLKARNILDAWGMRPAVFEKKLKP